MLLLSRARGRDKRAREWFLPSLPLRAVALFILGYLIPSPLQLSRPKFCPPFAIESPPLEDAPDAAHGTAPSAGEGVDGLGAYLDLLAEAERRSASDFEASHARGARGVLIGPVDGEFRHVLRALRNARRVRNVLPPRGGGVRVAIVMSRAHADALGSCGGGGDVDGGAPRPRGVTQVEHYEACRLWANGTLVDDVVFNREPTWVNESHARQSGGNGRYKMISMGGALVAPYKETLVLDSDAYPCPGFEKIFVMLWPRQLKRYRDKLWALPSTAPVDLATGLDQYFESGGKWTLPGDSGLHSDFPHFPERNCGTVLWNFRRQLTHTFAHFLLLVGEHMYNHVATPDNLIYGEQTPFRVALYLFRKLRPSFNEQHFPSHVSCRTYVDVKYSGIDGARNGMYPMQSDGRICSECHCTPCLINHNAGTYFVNINGKKGWEDDSIIHNASNSLPG